MFFFLLVWLLSVVSLLELDFSGRERRGEGFVRREGLFIFVSVFIL